MNKNFTPFFHKSIDNYATHKTKEVLEYVENSKGRIISHFIPTHSSWLNLVERWFAELTSKRIRRESWASVEELKKGIMNFIRNWNETDALHHVKSNRKKAVHHVKI